MNTEQKDIPSAKEIELPRCKICGDTVPQGKELCWCCEHTPKLHKMEKPHDCKEDSCEIHFPKKDGDTNG